ncbi:caspase, EACC1-associated type [Kribbella sp. GL6]|uniref:caspase, EACC1-associated type n=1 Tax=Kribbella sp. GL6 TaxID=3419765 RepID=UPI003D0541D4
MRRALLVATYEYDDAGLRRLAAPERDVQALAAVLEDPAIAGFDVQVVMNRPTHEVGRAIADFFDAGERDDLMLLYFSGHGLKDDSGRLYLAMKNTDRNSLRFTALSSQLVRETVSESRPRRTILILDCCYSGAYAAEQFGKGDPAVHTKDAFGGRGRIVLTASDSTQYAYEGTESVFTHHLVEGLRTGAADLDGDGDITTDELYDYTYDAVIAEQPSQRPKRIAEAEGRTVIASNAHWALPDHLVAAINNPVADTRKAALERLGQLLQANNEQVRRAAREQLEVLRDDDSRSIATIAQAYLDNPMPTNPQPAPTTPRRYAGPTFGAAARATASRWRDRFRLPEWDWPIIGLALIAAAAQVGSAVVASPRLWQLIVVAVLAVAVVPVVIRLGGKAPAFAIGLAGPALVAMGQAIGWLTHKLMFGGVQPLPATWYAIASAAWLVAGVVGLLRLRRTPPVRDAANKLLIGLGAVAAILLLLILVYVYRHARVHPPAVTALYLLAAEVAIVGPVVRFSREFLAGWVVSGFVLMLGFLRFETIFDLPQVAGIAVLTVWLALGVATVLPLKAGKPFGRRITLGAAVAPAVLGIVAVIVVPPAPRIPLALGLAVSPDNQYLYATDVENGRLLRFSTTTQTRVGDPLRVGELPSNLIVAADGSRLYVANSKSNSISVVDAANWAVVGGPIAVAPGPTKLALNPTTHRLFVLSQDSATITEINTDTLATVGGPLAAGPNPTDVAVDEKNRLYVALRDAGTVAVLDATSRQAVRSPIPVGAGPQDLVPGPDGALYVVGRTTYAVINTQVESTRPSPESLPDEAGSAAAGGEQLFVVGSSGHDDTVWVVDVGRRKVVGTLTGNLGLPARIAVSPDGRRIYLSRFFQPGIDVLDSSGPKQLGVISTNK